MPRRNGVEFLQHYAPHPSNESPAVAISRLTTSFNSQAVEQMHSLPIAPYLTKPLTPKNRQPILQKHVGHAAT